MLRRVINSALRRCAAGIGALAPLQKNKVFVSSYYGRGYGDNPKYVVKALLQNDPSLRIMWLVKDAKEGATLPEGVEAIQSGTPAAAYHMATAKVWLDNCRRNYFVKRKAQYYIQTWHGFALKRIESDVADHLAKSYVQSAKKDSKAIDLIVSEAGFMSEIYQRAFWYNGRIAQWGSPRNDIMLSDEDRKQCKKRVAEFLGIDSSVKIVMYAPTFRANRSLEPYSLEYKGLKEACEQRFGGEFKVFVRLHPTIMLRSKELNLEGQDVLDVSAYPDMQELLAAADVVISDYSSLMFDFALSGKPCFQFATDIEEYKGDRNFYFQLDQLPFSVAQDNSSLARDILQFDQKKYEQELDAFFDEVGMVRTGKASTRCAELISLICKGNSSQCIQEYIEK